MRLHLRSNRPIVAALLWTALAAPPAAAQPGAPPPEVAAAQAALRAGQPDSAITTLLAYFTKNPQATAGRLVLGNAYRQRGDLDKALSTFLGITQPRPMQLQAMFNAAAIHAVRGNAAGAITLLVRLKESGAFDMNLAKSSKDFAALSTNARFAAAMFQPADFIKPFVEPAIILREFTGETAGDQFSWIARSVGDVNGDGVSDLVTSAPTYGASSPTASRGRVYVYSGLTGALLWKVTGAEGESLGLGLEGAGDVNRDGVGDVIAGAPGGNRAYVYSGRDGSVLHTLAGTTATEGFGRSAASAGDQNGDGYVDLIVGAPASAVRGEASGRAYVFSGRDGAVMRILNGAKAGDAFGSIVAGDKRGTRTRLVVGASGAGPSRGTTPPPGRVYVYNAGRSTPAFQIDAELTGGALGAMFASLVGDVNHDGVTDVYAADFSDAAKGPNTGRVYVHSGKTGKRLLTLVGEHANDGFGIGSADVGDANGDGFADLLIGAWQYSAAAASGGRVYLYSGKDGALLRTITGRVPGETLGFDATGIGDVNGDGLVDLLITSSWSNVNGFRSGRMYIVAGTR